VKKIVINRSGTGFDVSQEGFEYLIKECGWKVAPLPENDEDFEKIDCDLFELDETGLIDFVTPDLQSINLRTSADIIEMVEFLGERANTDSSNLIVIGIPTEIAPMVLNDNGFEYVVDRCHVWPHPEV
jgi:hypothetical protein